MDESILTSIKKLLGLTEDYTAFDDQLIIHINSVILVLKQIGVCDTAYTVRDKLTHGVSCFQVARILKQLNHTWV